MRKVTVYEATDGTQFDTEVACNDYEAKLEAETEFTAWYEGNELWGHGYRGKVEVGYMLEWLRENAVSVMSVLEVEGSW